MLAPPTVAIILQYTLIKLSCCSYQAACLWRQDCLLRSGKSERHCGTGGPWRMAGPWVHGKEGVGGHSRK